MPGDSVSFFDLSTGDPTQWTWTFEGGEPGSSAEQNPANIVYPAEGSYFVKLRTKNPFGNNTNQKDDYILVGYISVKDRFARQGMFIYPNPSQGKVQVRLPAGLEAGQHGGMVEVTVLNSTGNMIRTFSISLAEKSFSFDLGGEPDGLYIIRVKADNQTIQEKISLLK
jgi:PKD repeat protein